MILKFRLNLKLMLILFLEENLIKDKMEFLILYYLIMKYLYYFYLKLLYFYLNELKVLNMRYCNYNYLYYLYCYLYYYLYFLILKNNQLIDLKYLYDYFVRKNF